MQHIDAAVGRARLTVGELLRGGIANFLDHHLELDGLFRLAVQRDALQRRQRGTEEQSTGADHVRRATEDVSSYVKGIQSALKEQARVSASLTEMIEDAAARIDTISRSVAGQQEASGLIVTGIWR